MTPASMTVDILFREFWLGNLTASRKLPPHFKNMPLSLERLTKFAQLLSGSSSQLQLGFVILSSDYLEPYKSQLPKSHSSLTQNSGLGACYADRDSDTLSNGGGRDRLFAN